MDDKHEEAHGRGWGRKVGDGQLGKAQRSSQAVNESMLVS